MPAGVMTTENGMFKSVQKCKQAQNSHKGEELFSHSTV